MPEYIGGYAADSEFFSMTHTEFVEYCGGLASVALFRGEFGNSMHNAVNMAFARGIKHQMEVERGLRT